jgi:sulfite reductase alpha subunit-like flavoprotein
MIVLWLLCEFPQTKSTSAHIVVGVLKFITQKGRSVHGVCSRFLSRIQAGGKLRVFVQPTEFHLPSDSTIPIIMAAAGTGIAPFVGFLKERIRLVRSGFTRMGKAYLYYGCRDEHTVIFTDVIREALLVGALTDCHFAYSDVSPFMMPMFLQERLAYDSEELFKLLHYENAHLYVCGFVITSSEPSSIFLACFLDISPLSL